MSGPGASGGPDAPVVVPAPPRKASDVGEAEFLLAERLEVPRILPPAPDFVDLHDAKGTLHRGDGPYVAPPPPA